MRQCLKQYYSNQFFPRPSKYGTKGKEWWLGRQSLGGAGKLAGKLEGKLTGKPLSGTRTRSQGWLFRSVCSSMDVCWATGPDGLKATYCLSSHLLRAHVHMWLSSSFCPQGVRVARLPSPGSVLCLKDPHPAFFSKLIAHELVWF